MLRKLIAANQIAGGASWMVLMPLFLLSGRQAAQSFFDLVLWGCEFALYGAAIYAGYLLWHNDRRGYRLSIAIQACQLLKLTSSLVAFNFTCGLSLTYAYAPYVPKAIGRSTLQAGFGPIPLGGPGQLAFDSPFSLGVNVVAAMCLLWLIRHVRALKTRPAAPPQDESRPIALSA
jgi:hypothetical protein